MKKSPPCSSISARRFGSAASAVEAMRRRASVVRNIGAISQWGQAGVAIDNGDAPDFFRVQWRLSQESARVQAFSRVASATSQALHVEAPGSLHSPRG